MLYSQFVQLPHSYQLVANRLNRQQKYSTDNILKVSPLSTPRKLSQLAANIGNCPPKAEVVSSNLAGRASAKPLRSSALRPFNAGAAQNARGRATTKLAGRSCRPGMPGRTAAMP